MTRLALTVLSLAAVALLVPAAAGAAPSQKKAIWGPTDQFDTYADLGAGFYETTINWASVAPTRPANATDPNDPAYQWPAELDQAIQDGQSRGIRIALVIWRTPPWANGGKSSEWVPTDPRDYAAFAEAVARRYPAIDHFMIWAEPTRKRNWQPLVHETRNRPLNRRQRRAPRHYARMLDSAYLRIKGVSRRNVVIGGMTFVTGDVSPRNWIRYMRLPNGRPPRMDLYGHNPFGSRRPNLRKRPLGQGFADFSDLDTLAGWMDRYLRRRGIRLFLSEYTLPTDEFNHEFNFYVTRATQADIFAAGLRITRRWRRIYTMGYLELFDEPPRSDGLEALHGLITQSGERKPGYFAFRRG